MSLFPTVALILFLVTVIKNAGACIRTHVSQLHFELYSLFGFGVQGMSSKLAVADGAISPAACFES